MTVSLTVHALETAQKAAMLSAQRRIQTGHNVIAEHHVA